MTVEILTPESTLYKGEASYVFLPGSNGSMGVLNRHAPMIVSLKKGSVRIKDNSGKEHRFDLNGGTVEVLNNRVIILAD